MSAGRLLIVISLSRAMNSYRAGLDRLKTCTVHRMPSTSTRARISSRFSSDALVSSTECERPRRLRMAAARRETTLAVLGLSGARAMGDRRPPGGVELAGAAAAPRRAPTADGLLPRTDALPLVAAAAAAGRGDTVR